MIQEILGSSRLEFLTPEFLTPEFLTPEFLCKVHLLSIFLFFDSLVSFVFSVFFVFSRISTIFERLNRRGVLGVLSRFLLCLEPKKFFHFSQTFSLQLVSLNRVFDPPSPATSLHLEFL